MVSSNACVLAAEMDGLIMKIQQGLRLKAKEKQHTYRHASTTPYSFPCFGSKQSRSSSGHLEMVFKPRCRRIMKRTNKIDLEPHKLLQKLLKEQTLIQEAVKRLQERTSSCELNDYSDYEHESSDCEMELNSNTTRVSKES
ncbi:uncharacterized protein LOC135465933 [Liolophura sinensis]|uniref:uncharacterized protein LOC135465933 n=1 Tax=Liolophura sinensis TaxID=3198878 RepID=UPI003158823E